MRSMRSKRGSNEVNQVRYVFVAAYEVDKIGGINDIESFYNIMDKLMETTQREGRNGLQVVIPEGLNPDYARKILEGTARKSDMAVTILTATDPQAKTRKTKQSREENYAITVRSGEKTYAELVKTVKDGMAGEETGVKITRIRKTAAGHMLLNIDGGEEKARNLRYKICNKTKDLQVKVASNKATIIVSGMEITATNEETVNALAKELGTDAREVDIKHVRTRQYGELTAIVEVPKDTVGSLLKRGTIRIGLPQCRVVERIELPRCYRCLDFGHRTTDCQGEDRSDRCVKCRQVDHRVNDCTKQAYCWKCKRSGHRADQMRCPSFKKLVEARRKARLARI
nr:uncharacterized protein LOC111504844 [Leptinotarsa decemlineata]